jgi:hypothetical protein
VQHSGSGLVFNNTFEASCTTAYINCIVAAESELSSLFSNAVTINEDFTQVNEGNNGDALSNSFWIQDFSYSQLKNALPGSDVLPATDPSGGGTWFVPVAYGRMLGLTGTTETADDTTTLNSYYGWSYGQDVINGVMHELSEGSMGRVGSLGGSSGVGGGNWSTMDLFRYNSSGVADYSNGRDGDTTYFSSNGGSTLSDANNPSKGAPTLSYNNQYNSDGTFNNGGDTADWVQQSVFGSTGTGETLSLTQTELSLLQALGWTLTLTQDEANTSGSWETPTNWSTGCMPIEPQDALINATVTLDSSVLVNSISTTSGGLLEIGDSASTTLTALHGTTLNSEDSSSIASGNAGEIAVFAGSGLQIGYFTDTFNNTGSLYLGKGTGTGYLYLTGDVTFNGGGTIYLGDSSSQYGDVFDSSSLTGDSLTNVDNTIVGQGYIGNTGTLDNQAAGNIEAKGTLYIATPTFTNEGVVTVEASSILDLGAGVTGSMTNTGGIVIDASADLQFSGGYTFIGSGGYIDFNGAGAEITSDGFGPATFTNAGTIYGYNSGQIGDSNLTFVNTGTLYAYESGVTVTLNTGSNTINDGGGNIYVELSGTLDINSNVHTGVASGTAGTIEVGVAGTGGTVVLGSTATISDGVSGPSVTGQVIIDSSGTFEMLAGSKVTVPIEFTGGGTLEILGTSTTVSVSGSSGTVTATSGDVINLTSGTGDTVTGTGFTVNGSSGTGVTVGGNGIGGAFDVVNASSATVGVKAASRVKLNGSNDTVTMTSGSASNLAVYGSTDSISVASGDGVWIYTGTGDTVTGTGFSAFASSGTGVTAGGNGIAGAFDNVNGSNFTLGVQTASRVKLTGSTDSVTMTAGSASNLAVFGSTDTVSAAAGDGVWFYTGTGDTANGTGFTTVAANGTGVTVGGNTISGTVDIVDGSGFTLTEETNSNLKLNGSNDKVTMTAGSPSNLYVVGSNDTVAAAATGDTFSMVSGTGDTFNGTGGFTVTGSASTGFKITGTGDIVYAGMNDAITDGGSSSTFKIKNANMGSLAISGFGSDLTHGIIDLLGGVGGYGTAAAAYNALTSDGSGGSLLSLGVDGSIDIKGVAKSSMSASNFKIG